MMNKDNFLCKYYIFFFGFLWYYVYDEYVRYWNMIKIRNIFLLNVNNVKNVGICMI